jgi:predicted RNA-binding Zn ribbon-like protein
VVRVPVAAPPFSFDAERLSLDFLSTLSNRASEAAVERLPDPDRLGAWLDAAGLGPLARPVTARDLTTARGLRTALFALVDAAMSRGGPGAAVDVVNRAAAPALPPTLLVDGLQGIAGQRRLLSVREALSAVARDAIDLLAGEAVSRLRECEAEDCTGLYLDASHGRRRRWCSAARCGNRARVSAHRARARRDG